jgi:hypothetical protein
MIDNRFRILLTPCRQYPIDAGANYTYTYTPLQHGQYWYVGMAINRRQA